MYLRQRQSIRPGVEFLEEREMFDANSPLGSALMQFRNDLATSAVALVQVAQPSPTNTPTMASIQSQLSKTWSELRADWSKMYQAFVQVEYEILGAMAQEFDTLLHDLGIPLLGRSSSPSPQAAVSSSDSPSGRILPPVAPADPPSTTSLTVVPATGPGQLKQSQ
jgi:hypothetical protein